ncbi:hypothetical protein SAMN05444412_11622 [Rhodonellum ikkaensis]|uniref:Uncharacterized protein n=1 Tax=Rhodonellum ikkaensis TaxID=336829 RepID=A0A1H3TAM5_9BACT|nr:hypothetical protein SAMN05444412_11622 [Rhodonellum ikkaensis]
MRFPKIEFMGLRCFNSLKRLSWLLFHIKVLSTSCVDHFIIFRKSSLQNWSREHLEIVASESLTF